MQTRISHIVVSCLVLLGGFCMSANARPLATDSTSKPVFPPDPGVVYVPPMVVIMGDTIDMSDTTVVMPTEIDIYGDSSVVYNTEENTLTLTSVAMEVGDSTGTAISYSGSDTLTIVLQDTSSIYADTIISSTSNVVIKGEGTLTAEGTVPIIGVPTASIRFDSVTMYVRSVPDAASLRRRIRTGVKIDENGGPAMSGFGSADFNKTGVTPPDALYGPVPGSGEGDEEEFNALYTMDPETGEADVLDEFWLTAQADDDTPVGRVILTPKNELDVTQPMYNILGLPVDAMYKGIVVQGGRKYILK